MYRILSAILNTGNIEFTAITSQHQTDKSEVPNSEALENGEIQGIRQSKTEEEEEQMKDFMFYSSFRDDCCHDDYKWQIIYGWIFFEGLGLWEGKL